MTEEERAKDMFATMDALDLPFSSRFKRVQAFIFNGTHDGYGNTSFNADALRRIGLPVVKQWINDHASEIVALGSKK